MPVKAIKIDSLPSRAILLAAAAVLLTGAFFSVKWGLANTAASKAEYKEVAELTVSWAPDDPQTHYTSAVLHERTFLPEDLPVSLSEYEKAAALAPHNFLLWLELGKARERNGDPVSAERTLRKALELAPNYAQVRWALGNNLLRQGRSDEAFTEIRQAASSDEKYVGPAASMAWQVFDGDINLVRNTIGDSARINVALSAILMGQKRLDEAFAIWELLTPEEKSVTFKQASSDLYGHLLDARKYRAALAVFSSALAGKDDDEGSPGKISNGGFENAIKPQNAAVFEWQIAEALKPQIAADTAQKHTGMRSLVLIFNSDDGKDFRTVSQTIVVEPGKTYQLELFYKSDLKTAATFKWEVAGFTDGKILSTEPVAESADWTPQRLKFTVPANTEAIAVRLARVPCRTGLCSITGRIWFDDLTLSAE
jgi:tetratricopeptide (TPR) repeat protein